MTSLLTQTKAALELARSQHEEIIISYSGGKDSLCCLDLLTRYWEPHQIHGYFLYMMPNLEFEQSKIKRAVRKFGIHIDQFPHPELQKMLREGYLTTRPVNFSRNMKYADYYELMRDRTGAKLICFGQRMQESLQRRGMIMSTTGGTGYDPRLAKLFPICQWNSKSVSHYLQSRKLSDLIVDTGGLDTSGVSLAGHFLIWLEERHPEDFERVCRLLPFARAKSMRERQRLAKGLTVMGNRS